MPRKAEDQKVTLNKNSQIYHKTNTAFGRPWTGFFLKNQCYYIWMQVKKIIRVFDTRGNSFIGFTTPRWNVTSHHAAWGQEIIGEFRITVNESNPNTTMPSLGGLRNTWTVIQRHVILILNQKIYHLNQYHSHYSHTEIGLFLFIVTQT